MNASAWKGTVGRSFTPVEFDDYCHSLRWLAWRPSFVVLHNTGVPSLAQRPAGLTYEHIQNLERYYRVYQGWRAGPHLFVDDRQIWVFTPLTVSGVHSPSWNKVSIGVEMLGDYSRESFDNGRGKKVQDNAVSALATLHGVLGLDPQSLRLHREDPRTTHDCPGRLVEKRDVIRSLETILSQRHAGDHAATSG